MLANLTAYFEPIMTACLLFPFAAALFTIPFMVLNYRRYGGIALMRVLVVYSFILYSMCAFLLTVLPLPTRASVAASPAPPIGWVPFTDLVVGLRKAGFLSGGLSVWLEPGRWAAYLRSRDFFQIAANVVMQVPLGFYLRYYFRCSLKRTLLIGFLVSLFYELTQLSGLFFIYAHAYRFASVDDLITNTLGALLGYAVTPLLALPLPTRDQIDRISYRKGEHLTLLRRMLAATLDMLTLGLLVSGAGLAGAPLVAGPILFLGYFVLLPFVTGGRTPGQALLKLRVVREGTQDKPSLLLLLIRYVTMYFVEPLAVVLAMGALMGLVITLTAEGLSLTVFLVLVGGGTGLLLLIVWFFLNGLLRWGTFPHGHWSRTRVVPHAPKDN